MTKSEEIFKTFGNKVRVRVCGILIENGKLLLVKHLHIGKDGYLWAPPGGGLNYNEKTEACLAREFEEETGLVVRVREFMFVNEFINHPLHAIELFFRVEVIEGNLRKGSDPELTQQNQMIEEVLFLGDDFLSSEKPGNLHDILIRAKTIKTLETLKGYYSSE